MGRGFNGISFDGTTVRAGASALDAHVVIEDGRWAQADAIKSVIKSTLRDRFDIDHATLELECTRHACDETSRFGRDHGDPEEDSHTDTAD